MPSKHVVDDMLQLCSSYLCASLVSLMECFSDIHINSEKFRLHQVGGGEGEGTWNLFYGFGEIIRVATDDN